MLKDNDPYLCRIMYQQLREHIEQVVPLSDEEFALLSRYFVYKKFRRNDAVISEGEKVVYNYYILSGLTKMVYTDRETTKEHILSFAMEDWWDNDLGAYYTGGKATLSMICLEDTEVLGLSLADFTTLRAELPKLETFFLEKSIRGMLSAQRRILSLMTSSAQERYEQLIRQYPKLLQRVPKTHLAAYLGVSREHLSRS